MSFLSQPGNKVKAYSDPAVYRQLLEMWLRSLSEPVSLAHTLISSQRNPLGRNCLGGEVCKSKCGTFDGNPAVYFLIVLEKVAFLH